MGLDKQYCIKLVAKVRLIHFIRDSLNIYILSALMFSYLSIKVIKKCKKPVVKYTYHLHIFTFKNAAPVLNLT